MHVACVQHVLCARGGVHMDMSVCVKVFLSPILPECMCGCVCGEALKWIQAGVHSACQEDCSWLYHS